MFWSFPVKLDTYTHAMPTIDYAHHEIHGGSHFYASKLVTGDTDDELVLVVTTPNTTKWAHMVIGGLSIKGAGLYVYENPVLDSDGTAVTAFNRDRNSSTAATCVITHSPAGDSELTYGTQLDFSVIGTVGQGGKHAGGLSRSSAEWILKQNENYLIRMVSLEDGNFMKIELDWYEHTNLTDPYA